MPGQKIVYYDSDGNRKVYIGDPRKFKKPRMNKKKEGMRKKQEIITKPPASMMKDTTTSAYGDAGKGRPVPFYNEDRPKGMKEGGVCRGAGAAIKGTKFEGVF
mgnify:CR=1 FL=1